MSEPNAPAQPRSAVTAEGESDRAEEVAATPCCGRSEGTTTAVGSCSCCCCCCQDGKDARVTA